MVQHLPNWIEERVEYLIAIDVGLVELQLILMHFILINEKDKGQMIPRDIYNEKNNHSYYIHRVYFFIVFIL